MKQLQYEMVRMRENRLLTLGFLEEALRFLPATKFLGDRVGAAVAVDFVGAAEVEGAAGAACP